MIADAMKILKIVHDIQSAFSLLLDLWEVRIGLCQATVKYFPEMMWPGIEGVNKPTVALDRLFRLSDANSFLCKQIPGPKPEIGPRPE